MPFLAKVVRRFTKWHHPSRNAQVGDVVFLEEDGLVPRKWPLARITGIYTGRDGLVRITTVKTAKMVLIIIQSLRFLTLVYFIPYWLIYANLGLLLIHVLTSLINLCSIIA